MVASRCSTRVLTYRKTGRSKYWFWDEKRKFDKNSTRNEFGPGDVHVHYDCIIRLDPVGETGFSICLRICSLKSLFYDKRMQYVFKMEDYEEAMHMYKKEPCTKIVKLSKQICIK